MGALPRDLYEVLVGFSWTDFLKSSECQGCKVPNEYQSIQHMRIPQVKQLISKAS